jgi:hypothetical protein
VILPSPPKPRVRVAVLGSKWHPWLGGPRLVSTDFAAVHETEQFEFLIEVPWLTAQGARVRPAGAIAADVLIVVAGTDLDRYRAELAVLRLHGLSALAIAHLTVPRDGDEEKAREQLLRRGFDGDGATIATVARPRDLHSWLSAIDAIAKPRMREGFLAVRTAGVVDNDKEAGGFLADMVWGEAPDGEVTCTALTRRGVEVLPIKLVRSKRARAGDDVMIIGVDASAVTTENVRGAHTLRVRRANGLPAPQGPAHAVSRSGGSVGCLVEEELVLLEEPLLVSDHEQIALLPHGVVVDVVEVIA